MMSKEYILTGEDAELIAVQEARLRAIVTTESNLNVRKEPSADSKKITKITTDERYDVLNQVNGWIEISLEGNDDGKDMSSGFISADYAEVKYALIEAYEFSPVTEFLILEKFGCKLCAAVFGQPLCMGRYKPD